MSSDFGAEGSRGKTRAEARREGGPSAARQDVGGGGGRNKLRPSREATGGWREKGATGTKVGSMAWNFSGI